MRSLDAVGADVWPNHGWRHRFRVECQGIAPEANVDFIQGHVPLNVARDYNRPPPRKLAPWIKKVPRYEIEAVPGAKKAKQAVGVGSSP